MEVSQSTRQFKYNGVALQDPGPGFSLEQVREFYATLYPEIINAAIEGPTISGSKTVYEFRRAVGTKGSNEVAERVERFIARRRARSLGNCASDYNRRLHETIAHAVDRPLHGKLVAPVPLPFEAVPLLP